MDENNTLGKGNEKKVATANRSRVSIRVKCLTSCLITVQNLVIVCARM